MFIPRHVPGSGLPPELLDGLARGSLPKRTLVWSNDPMVSALDLGRLARSHPVNEKAVKTTCTLETRSGPSRSEAKIKIARARRSSKAQMP